MTPVNFDNTPFIALASPSFPVGAPQVSWDPILGSWQPCQDETGPLVSATVLTPLSESSSTPIVKVSIALIFFIFQFYWLHVHLVTCSLLLDLLYSI